MRAFRALSAVALAVVSLAAAPAPKIPNCSAPQHHQFDFWIGRWDVFDTQTGKPAGKSLIEGLYRGCVLRENWQDEQLVGGSLNVYDRTDGKWHQMWTDSTGGDRHFTGGLENGKMVMISSFPSTRSPGTMVLYRMIFTPNKDGTVRQYSDLSSDQGKTWKTNYDLTYRRAR